MRCGDNETSCTYVNACKRDIRGVEKQMVIVRKTTKKNVFATMRGKNKIHRT